MINDYSISGFGVSSTGCYAGESGIPKVQCDWRAGHGTSEAVELTLRSSCVVDGVLYVWGSGQDAIRVPGRRRAINSYDLATRSREKLFIQTDGKATTTQIVFSGRYVFAGCTLLDANTWEVLASYDFTESKRNACFGELVNSPVKDGFLYMGGLSHLPPRTLYHIDAPSKELRVIRKDITRFVAEPMGEFYYALRDGDIICENWRTGEVVWQTELSLVWHDNLPEDEASRRGLVNNPKALVLSGKDVFVHIVHAGIYRFDKQTGRFVERLSSLRSRDKGRDIDSTLIMVAEGVLYRVFSPGDMSSGKSYTHATDIETGSTLFDSETEGNESAIGVVGDLIFYNKLADNVIWHIARDRFNGEIVWESQDAVNFIDSVQPVGNKLFFYSERSSMICFSWDKPYISPDRP